MLPTPLVRQLEAPQVARLVSAAGADDLETDRAPAAILLAYHALARLLEENPCVGWVRPVWKPEVAPEDESFRLRFFVEMFCQDGPVKRRRRYGQDLRPQGWSDAQLGLLEAALEACGKISVGMWNAVASSALASKTAYTCVAQMDQDMERDVGPVLARLRQWGLEHQLPPAAGPGLASRL